MNDLLIGLLSGAVLASGTLTLRSWRRKHRLKQPWLHSGQSMEQLQDQLELSQQLEQQQQIRINELRQQLSEQQTQHQAQQRKFVAQQQQLQTVETRCEQLAQAKTQAKAETEELLKVSDEEIKDLEGQLTVLQNELESLEQERDRLTETALQLEQDQASLQDRLEAEILVREEAQARLQTGMIGAEQFAEAIARLLPNLIFLRDSMEVMLQESPVRQNALLSSLRALSDGSLTQNHHNNGIKVMKVHATDNKWSEFHVPNASMMRVYFYKLKGNDSGESSQSGRYQVLVTEKKDPKTQGKNHAWLKSQSVS